MKEKMDKRIGNRFWELRSKHGRNTLFETPELMWEAACEYFKWCEDNPFIAIEYNGKDAIACEVPKMRPFTLHGICSYFDCNIQYFSDFKTTKTYVDKGFSLVVTRIEETIYNQKFSGAAAGFLKENIIARDLGLTDKKDVTSGGDKIQSDLSKLTTEQLALLEQLQQAVNNDT